MTLKLKVGRKGYIILPKAVREAVGLEEGDEVIVEVKDYIILKPVRRFNREVLEKAFREHLKRLEKVPDLREPKPGELSGTYLEEEFEE